MIQWKKKIQSAQEKKPIWGMSKVQWEVQESRKSLLWPPVVQVNTLNYKAVVILLDHWVDYHNISRWK